MTGEEALDAEAGLARLASLLGSTRPGAEKLPGAGAAGGTGFGLLAWGAHARPGADSVAELIGLSALLADADLVVTGEGRFDAQTAGGKVPQLVSTRAGRAGAAIALAAGLIEAPTPGYVLAVSLTDLAGSSARAREDAPGWLTRAGVELAREWDAVSSPSSTNRTPRAAAGDR
jgi:glycerate 2-kinase